MGVTSPRGLKILFVEDDQRGDPDCLPLVTQSD